MATEIGISTRDYDKKKGLPNSDKITPKKTQNAIILIKNSGENAYSLPIRKASVRHITPRRQSFKVVIRKVERPFNEDFDHGFAWICSTLGFFEPIDKDKNAAAVFKEIVLATERGQALTSTTLAERIGMSRGSTINHLNNLLCAGLVEKRGHYYSARSKSIQRTIEEIEEDVDRIFEQLKKKAAQLDKQFLD